ncbi:hypothetical protein K7X08_025041 [Anisodus acutangulus]|uniref:Uncharacterized protein n=1 Tax=Anisodus acutangulus TaxID=402998 RepID=A0A9Q1RGI8_9SOLA|nr:hypothetical protein K7X08_025041 [Anisodus acutangulus]
MESTQKSSEYLDMSEYNSNDDFPALLSKLPCIEPEEEEKSVTITQEPPKFSYATILAKKTSTSPSGILPKKVVRVAASDTESRSHTGPVIVVGPKEKVVCARGLQLKSCGINSGAQDLILEVVLVKCFVSSSQITFRAETSRGSLFGYMYNMRLF